MVWDYVLNPVTCKVYSLNGVVSMVDWNSQRAQAKDKCKARISGSKGLGPAYPYPANMRAQKHGMTICLTRYPMLSCFARIL
jgi:hypothetical protein